MENDIKVAMDIPEVDLVLGGHDHIYKVIDCKGVPVVKSGHDFHDFSYVTTYFDVSPEEFQQVKKERESWDGFELIYNEKKQIFFETRRIEIFSAKYAADPNMVKHNKRCYKDFDMGMDKIIGWAGVDLEFGSEKQRIQETNAGNFLTDLLRTEYDTDFSMINSGTMRLEEKIPAGPIKAGDLHSLLPFGDTVTVIKITGDCLKRALENGVSTWPNLDGRFPQISGFSFCFDSDEPVGQRVKIENISTVANALISPYETYTLATLTYLTDGGMDYTMFRDEGVRLYSEDYDRLLINIPRQFFKRTSHKFRFFKIVNNKVEEQDSGFKITRTQQLSQFNAFAVNKNHSMVFDLNPDSTWIMVSPAIEGRTTNLAENRVPKLNIEMDKLPEVNFRELHHKKAKEISGEPPTPILEQKVSTDSSIVSFVGSSFSSPPKLQKQHTRRMSKANSAKTNFWTMAHTEHKQYSGEPS